MKDIKTFLFESAHKFKVGDNILDTLAQKDKEVCWWRVIEITKNGYIISRGEDETAEISFGDEGRFKLEGEK